MREREEVLTCERCGLTDATVKRTKLYAGCSSSEPRPFYELHTLHVANDEDDERHPCIVAQNAEIVRLREALAAATRVRVLDEWVVVSKDDKVQSIRVPHRDDDLARIANEWFPNDAPHRIVRVALVNESAREGPRDE